MSEPAPTCRVCAGERLLEITEFRNRRRVTSDCRPWRAGGRLGACADCGLVQALAHAGRAEELAAIYADYAPYHQAAGQEQPVFDSRSGAASPRSRAIISALISATRLPATGRLLDIGCGNGGFLREFAAQRPAWRMVALEQDARHEAVVRAIPQVEKLVVGGAENLEGSFDQVVMLHLLEHLAAPVDYLRALQPRLKPAGRLLVATPDLAANPFALVIADHELHFTGATLARLAARAGLAPEPGVELRLPKELIALWRSATGETAPRASEPARSFELAQRALRWLADLVALARAAGAERPFGILGTSIAGAWLAGELADRFDFFADEDPARQGRTFLGRPVLAPAAAGKARIIVALPPAVAAPAAARLEGGAAEYVLPPEW